MGKPGKIAFPVILVLGAITGYITYTSFTAAIPDENIDSPYYQPLSPGSSGNVPGDTGGAAQQQQGGATNQTGGANATTTAGGANATNQTGGANATTTTTAGGAPMGNATTTGTTGTGNATGTGTTGGEGGGATSVSIVPGSSSLTTDAFQPNPVQVSVGSTVTWTNDDAQPHTATSGQNATPDGTFDSGIMAPQGTFEHTFTEAGEFPYFCLLHPNMVGTVSVS
ncbi:MAG: plastocyanin/azurin family copper-binding protein [Thermoproteota archaeon]|nr:plastocyanin/azurin family copper-binding protein [Thermoproteota archaeon]